MCWITNKSKYTVKKEAEQDIPVFKVVKSINGSTICSFYYNHEYEIGKICFKTTPLKCLKEFKWGELSYIIKIGFHSYSKHCSYKVSRSTNNYNLLRVSLMNNITDGYFMGENPVIMHCVIPAGSEYYENERGEIVSNMLKPISIEEI